MNNPSVTDFRDRKLHRLPDNDFKRIRAKGLLEESDAGLATDWIMVASDKATDTKYCRLMYSRSLDQMRGLTMGEFYGSGIVD